MSQLGGDILVVASDLFSESTTQQHKIGSRATTPDGRVYRYAKAGATALVAGDLLQAPAIVANHQNLTPAAAAIGATTVTVTLGATAATADQYAEGFLVVNVAPGIGYTYAIKSNPAAALSATMVVTLDDTIQVALTASSRVSLIANSYNGVIQSPTVATSSPVGVGVEATTANSFQFIQVYGPCSVLSDLTVAAVGLGVIASTTTAGAITVATATGGNIGYALQAGVSAERRAVFLNID